MIKYKLLGEHCEYDEKDYEVISESNAQGEKHWYIQGPYTEADRRNRNGRVYPLTEMIKQVNELTENYISQKRCTGELEHPTYPDINYENAAILIESLKQDGNVFYGRSKVLSTPKGKIVEALLHDGVKLGVSSRALGSVNSDGLVTDFKLVTFDVVGDPSSQSAFVDGILEAKEWICNTDGKYDEVYEGFEKGLERLPKKDMDLYLREHILDFMRKLK